MSVGTHIGFVDTYENGEISGWSYTSGIAQQKILVKVNGELVRTIEANKKRSDVASAGFAPEVCGFVFTIDVDAVFEGEYIVTLQDAYTGSLLKNGILKMSAGQVMLCNDLSTVKIKELSVREYISIADMSNSRIEECEFVDLFIDKLSNFPLNKFVAMCYLVILGRVPDPQGFGDKMRHMNNSVTSKKSLVIDMLSTEEFKKSSSMNDARIRLSKVI